MHVSAVGREVGVSQGSPRPIKRVAVPVLVGGEPDLNVDTAALQVGEAQVRHRLPQVEALLDGVVHLLVGEAAPGRVLSHPVGESADFPPAALQDISPPPPPPPGCGSRPYEVPHAAPRGRHQLQRGAVQLPSRSQPGEGLELLHSGLDIVLQSLRCGESRCLVAG